MRSLFLKLYERTEAGQAFARAVIVSIAALYIAFFVLPSALAGEALRLALAGLIYAPLSILWYVYVSRRPQSFKAAQWRLYAAAAIDATLIGVTLGVVGEVGAGFLGLYLLYFWVILGNGLRFGIPHLDAAAVLCGLSLGLAALAAPGWPVDAGGTLTLALGLLVVHAFARLSLQRTEALAAQLDGLRAELRAALAERGDLGLAGRAAFLHQVGEAMARLPDGDLLAAIVCVFRGPEAYRVANPMSPLGQAVARRIQGELRTDDLAAFGAEDALWLCLRPQRFQDAVAVAERVTAAIAALAPGLEVKTGFAHYPAFAGDAERLFAQAGRNAYRGARGAEHLRVVDD